jgi:hypothetical protein
MYRNLVLAVRIAHLVRIDYEYSGWRSTTGAAILVEHGRQSSDLVSMNNRLVLR